jgi:hypothetical protein
MRRTISFVRRLPSCVPWEKFKRATVIPARIMARMVSGDSVAGPSVQTIFVRGISTPFCWDCMLSLKSNGFYVQSLDCPILTFMPFTLYLVIEKDFQ